MSVWKAFSPKRKEKLNYGAMMRVAREARILGLLNFNIDGPFCPEEASFTVDVGDGVTGTVTLTNRTNDPDLVHVVLEFDTVYIQGNLYKMGAMFMPFPHFIPENIYSTGGIPNSIVDMAMNPVTFQEAYGY